MIVTLCGSSRHGDLFQQFALDLSLAGHAPIGLSSYDRTQELNVVEKALVDGAHLRRISASHAVVVLNVDGYVGESVIREIVYANDCGKRVFFLEPHLTAKGRERVDLESMAGHQLKTGKLCQARDHLYSFDTPSSVDAALELLGRGGSHRTARMAN